jgi:hypothetical protein
LCWTKLFQFTFSFAWLFIHQNRINLRYYVIYVFKFNMIYVHCWPVSLKHKIWKACILG